MVLADKLLIRNCKPVAIAITGNGQPRRRQSDHQIWLMLSLSVLFILCVAIDALPQTELPNNKQSPVRISRFATPPVINGNLNDEVWQQAAVLKDFLQTQPGDNIPATHPTEVRFGYDDKTLYIGIHAFDEKGQVRATLAKRDDLSGNDYIAVWLDTFGDDRRAYVLFFNPFGIQGDGVFTEGQTIDYSVDIVMQSKGVVTDDGYTIEVAIPFSSIRYEAGKEKLWGVHVLRIVRHLDEWDSLMPLRRASRDFSTATFTQFLEQAGRLTGIEKGEEKRSLELIPTLTLAETGRRVHTISPASFQQNPVLPDNGRFINEPIKADVGLTAKMLITSGVTLDATINPDFAQVEADQLVVTANQRFPIFFEEKRPFFLEGVEVFQTPIRAVHTRTIIDPDVAVKLTGKRGRQSFGLLLASDNAPGNFSDEEKDDPALRPLIERFIDKNAVIGVLRYKRDVGKESSLGVLATSYNFIEKHNQVLSIDGRFTLSPATVFTFQVLGTTARRYFYEPEQDANQYRTGNGFAYYLRLQRSTRHMDLSLTGRGWTEDYRADVGFVSQTNTNPWDFIATYKSEPKTDARLISWSVSSASRAQFNWQGSMQYSFQSLRTQFNFKRQTYFKTDIYSDYQRLFEEEFGARRTATQAGAFFGVPERSTVYKGFTLEAGTSPSQKYAATLVVDHTWKAFDFDFGAGQKFPRVSAAALQNPDAPLDPGTGSTLDLTANIIWRPIEKFNASLNYIKSRLRRDDTRRLAYDQNLASLQTIYQFTRFTFARARLDYDTLQARVYGQFLVGWTPNPGTSFYVGYNDDLNRNGFNPFTGQYEPGLHRNRRTLFIKMSYLLRRAL